MTLLYGRDASGNQVPLLVDGSGIVQTSGGSTSWPGTSSQLTSGSGTAVTVGSGLSLSGGTLTAPNPVTLWEADFTTGQTAQTWTAGSTYAVVGTIGGNLNWKHQGTSEPLTVAMINGSGLEMTYGAGSTPASSVNLALSQLGLGYTSTRPWRIWLYVTTSGTITSGRDNQQISLDMDGTGASNSNAFPTNQASALFRTFANTGNSDIVVSGMGSVGPSVLNSVFYSDVIVFTIANGVATTSIGTWSAGFPATTALYPLMGGALTTYNTGTPYTANAGLSFRVAGSLGPINFTNRKSIIKACRIDGL